MLSNRLIMYDKKKLLERILDAIQTDKQCVFIEDVACLVGVSKVTIYRYYPIDSNEMNAIKDLLNANKTRIKRDLRKIWSYVSASASTQIALYKLLATDEEYHILNGTKKADDRTQTQIAIENLIPLKKDRDL